MAKQLVDQLGASKTSSLVASASRLKDSGSKEGREAVLRQQAEVGADPTAQLEAFKYKLLTSDKLVAFATIFTGEAIIQLVHSCAIYKPDEAARAKIIGFCGEKTARGNPIHLEMKPRKAFEWAKLKQPLMHNKDIVNYFNVPEQRGGLLNTHLR